MTTKPRWLERSDNFLFALYAKIPPAVAPVLWFGLGYWVASL